MSVRLSTPAQALVLPNKDSDSFTIDIPSLGVIKGIPAEFIPELRDQLHLIGGWLSCWSYLDGPEATDEEKAMPEQGLAWHTSDFIEEVIRSLSINQLQDLLRRFGASGTIAEIVEERLQTLIKANSENPSGLQ